LLTKNPVITIQKRLRSHLDFKKECFQKFATLVEMVKLEIKDHEEEKEYSPRFKILSHVFLKKVFDQIFN
jgi:hypothetical protein